MENNNLIQIPLAVHESDMEREDRKHKRMFILVIILITYSFLVTAVMIASNYWWIEYERSFEDVVTTTTTQTVTQDSGDGGTNSFSGDFIGGDYYGETDSNN